MSDHRNSSHQPDNLENPASKRPKTQISCAECRRTKTKCDREWPCGECRRKGLEALCPEQVSTNALPKTKTIAILTERVKDLENRLRRLGQEVEAPSVSSQIDEPIHDRIDETNGAPARPYDMTAMLGRLALGTTHAMSRQHVGSESGPFYLDSPAESEDEGEDSGSKTSSSRASTVPWARSRRADVVPWGVMPGHLLDQCRALLPSRRQAVQLWDAFWELTSWRVQPMTRTLFMDRILPSVYGSTNIPRPDQLAVCLSVFAAVLTLDPNCAAANDVHGSADEYVDMTWSCLSAGKFFTNTTIEDLIVLSMLGLCVLNSDDKKSPDSNFSLFGLAIRLAVIAGYHRDPALIYPDMPAEEMDARRRIWHELLGSDRLHCMPALLPNSIDLNHYDTKLPSDTNPHGYFVWKWTVGVQICRVVDYWTSARIPPYTVLIDIDAGIRRLYHALPASLRSSELGPDVFSLDRMGAAPVPAPGDATFPLQAASHGTEAPPGSAVRQHIRLAMHFCMLFFYLHRPCFIHAVVSNDASMTLSVNTMAETCQHVVTLTSAVMALDWSLSRWFSFSADLFSILHCLTVLIVKCPGDSRAHYMALLVRGTETLQWTCSLRPNSKNKALLRGAQKLLANARAQPSQPSLPSPNHPTPSDSKAISPWQDWLGTGGAALAGLPTTSLDSNGHAGMGLPINTYGMANPETSMEEFLAGLWQSEPTDLFGSQGDLNVGFSDTLPSGSM